MGRTNFKDRCLGCRMRQVLCLCPDLPSLDLATRLVVIMHLRETKTSTNTGRLATLALKNSALRVRGRLGESADLSDLMEPGRTPLLLYPSEASVELTPQWVSNLQRPITLFVPDGTWRQASKVGARTPELKSVPHVRLPLGAPSSYRLRRAPRSEAVSTLEAIARAMGILEGAHVQLALEELFEKMVMRTLWSKGKLKLSECQKWIPEAAIRERLGPGLL